ncbi:MAG: AtuA-related protein [Gemmatimonadota bacterium]
MKAPLGRIAIARSGDKGDTANIGVIAIVETAYPVLVKEVTAERIKQYFNNICFGDVERFELPNLGALNFLLHESLGGGGTVSLMLDAQGKTFAASVMGLEVEVPEDVLAACDRVLAGEAPGRPIGGALDGGAPAGGPGGAVDRG